MRRHPYLQHDFGYISLQFRIFYCYNIQNKSPFILVEYCSPTVTDREIIS